MFNDSQTQTAQIIAAATADQVALYLQTAAGALYVYEYIITFGREVDLFWKRKITLAAVLFFASRYISLCFHLFGFPFQMSLQSCVPVAYTSSIMAVVLYFPWAVFSGLRALALSSGAWPVALGVFCLSLGPLIVNSVNMGYSTLVQDGVVCGFVTQLSMSVAHSLVVISRVSLITAELLVLIITWRATLKTSRDIRALGQGMLLSATMFRDGVMYFVVLLFINVLHFIFTSLSITSGSAVFQSTSGIATLSLPLTAILVSRFLIDLQDAQNVMVHQGSLPSDGSLHLDRFIGSLGSALPAPDLSFQPSQRRPEVAGVDSDDNRVEKTDWPDDQASAASTVDPSDRV